jgi:hypothetical protein
MVEWSVYRATAQTNAVIKPIRSAQSSRCAYNLNQPKRREMMQAWADYLDRLRNDVNVVPGDFGQSRGARI